jgi:hypothetical protein
MDASISFGTDADAGIGIYRAGEHIRLHVLAADGSGRVDFVHLSNGDREQSAAFLRALAEHALTMAGELTRWPAADHDDTGDPEGSDEAEVRLPAAAH